MTSAHIVASLLLTIVERGPALTLLQTQGNQCVWCPQQLLPGRGVDLGGDQGWRPHACRRCHALRTRVVATYVAWNDHIVDCAVCTHGCCATAATLRIAHLAARQRIDRSSAWCLHCETLIRDGAFRPYLWKSQRGPVLSYAHARSCPAPPAEARASHPV
ncbi:hypothetical protein [Streptomyces sp. G45]|uniref:hypothetical protein n=1 Tax=Streptomyces sp. G45 TaxID=3406627 RepID=UPI003C226FDF